MCIISAHIGSVHETNARLFSRSREREREAYIIYACSARCERAAGAPKGVGVVLHALQEKSVLLALPSKVARYSMRFSFFFFYKSRMESLCPSVWAASGFRRISLKNAGGLCQRCVLYGSPCANCFRNGYAYDNSVSGAGTTVKRGTINFIPRSVFIALYYRAVFRININSFFS